MILPLNWQKMQKLVIFLVIFQFSCILSSTATVSTESNWVFASDFQPSELANLTPQEEHRLLLKSLWKKRTTDFIALGPTIYWEILAKCAGIDFCGLVEDEKTNRENTAIIKAAFDCSKKLQFQEHITVAAVAGFVGSLFENLWNDELFFLNETEMAKTFTKIISDFDSVLENATFYTTLRDEYKKKDSWQPKKTYLYGIPKSEEAFKKELSEFINDPLMKNTLAQFIFLFHSDEAEAKWPAKSILRNLALVPGKLEVVQKIYDESISKIVTMIEDVSPDQINFDQLFERDFEELSTILYRVLRKKIQANADLRRQISDWQSPLCSPTIFV